MRNESIRAYPTLYKEEFNTAVDSEDAELDRLFAAGHPVKDIMALLEEHRNQQKAALGERPLASYSEDALMHMGQRVADHVFCAIGNGFVWHPDGYGFDGEDGVDSDEPEFKIFTFNRQFSWNPLCEQNSALCRAAGLCDDQNRVLPLNWSFRRAAHNVAFSIWKHGTDEGDDGDQRAIAKRCLIGLAEQYPNDDAVVKLCTQYRRGR